MRVDLGDIDLYRCMIRRIDQAVRPGAFARDKHINDLSCVVLHLIPMLATDLAIDQVIEALISQAVLQSNNLPDLSIDRIVK